MKDFQFSFLQSSLCLTGANLIPKQVEQLQNKKKCWGWVYFCLYIGSPGHGGTCSQEFPSPGESCVFAFTEIWNIYIFCRIKQRKSGKPVSLVVAFVLMIFKVYIIVDWKLGFICTLTRADHCAPGMNDLIDRAKESMAYFSCYCSSGAYWLMPFLSKWSSIYLPLDDQISGFSYFLGRDKPSFPVVMVHSPCPLSDVAILKKSSDTYQVSAPAIKPRS